MQKTLKKYIKTLLWMVLFLCLVVIIATMHYLYTWLKPDFERGKNFDAKQLPYALILTDRNDNEIFRSFDQYNREWIDLESIPLVLQELTLLAEDKRFYSHPGIDPKGIVRAMYANVKAGRITQGASTLTQQLARKVFLTDDQSFERKFREMAIALGIESKLSKDEILELYLNVAPYGPTLSGVKGAAAVYFDTAPKDLSLSEMLVLVSLPQNPVQLSRQKKIADWLVCTEALLAMERDVVVAADFFASLAAQLQSGSCSSSQLERVLLRYAASADLSRESFFELHAELMAIELPVRQDWTDSDFQHWRFMVMDFLAEQNFSLEAYPGGLRIKTSIDQALQRDVLEYLRTDVTEQIATEYNANNIATVALDHSGRQPLIWIGSKDFWDESIHGQVDMLRSYRQIGSTMKPLVFSAFFDAGYDPGSVLWDTRVRFNGQDKIIQNADGRYYGAIQADKALASSRNVPAAQAVYLAGGETRIRTYLDDNFGFDINKRYPDHGFGWTIALGTSPVNLSDVSNAYATLATKKYQKICPIMSIETMHGESVTNPCECINSVTAKLAQKNSREDQHKKNTSNDRFCPQQAIDPATSFMISDILGNKYLRDFGDWQQSADVAIKSGTSSKRVDGELLPVDNLMVGYTPNVTVMTWAGNTNGLHLKPGSFGSVSIGKVWEDITLRVIQKYPDLQGQFVPPSNVKKVNGQWVRTDRETKKFSIPAMSFVAEEAVVDSP